MPTHPSASASPPRQLRLRDHQRQVARGCTPAFRPAPEGLRSTRSHLRTCRARRRPRARIPAASGRTRAGPPPRTCDRPRRRSPASPGWAAPSHRRDVLEPGEETVKIGLFHCPCPWIARGWRPPPSDSVTRTSPAAPKSVLIGQKFSGPDMTDDPHESPTLDDLVTSDPEVLGRRRVFRETRVPVEILFENLADGMSIDEFLDEYQTLDRDDVVVLPTGVAGIPARPDHVPPPERQGRPQFRARV